MEKKDVLVYTVHKAASMFLHKLTSEVAGALDLEYVSINNRKYQARIKQEGWMAFIEAPDVRVRCFGPIRAGEARPYFPERLDGYTAVLQVRDPRDVLTSLFFSHAYSHRKKEGVFNPSDEHRNRWRDQGIDRFVLDKAGEFRDRYEELCDHLLGREGVTLVKYEDMVADYDTWLSQFLSAFSHVTFPKGKLRRLMGYPSSHTALYQKLRRRHNNEFEIREENVSRHKRQVVPGDHRRKLGNETIEQLNALFATVLGAFEYDIQQPGHKAAPLVST